MVEPDNLMLEHLRAIRAEMTDMSEMMHAMSVGMTIIQQDLAEVSALRGRHRRDIAALKQRLDRIEKRLESVEWG